MNIKKMYLAALTAIALAVTVLFSSAALTGCSGLSEPATADDAANDAAASADMPAVGSHISLGSWRLKDGTSAGIEWRVLAVGGDNALVISEKLLPALPYNDTHENTTWEKCSLRAWLNGEFIETAFTDAERARIAETVVPNPNNTSFFWVDGGKTTRDLVFCLSTEEAKKYFSGDDDRRAFFLVPDGAMGDEQSGAESAGDWWLRSPGGLRTHAVSVDGYGSIIGLGVSAGRTWTGVRPAMWLSFE